MHKDSLSIACLTGESLVWPMLRILNPLLMLLNGLPVNGRLLIWLRCFSKIEENLKALLKLFQQFGNSSLHKVLLYRYFHKVLQLPILKILVEGVPLVNCYSFPVKIADKVLSVSSRQLVSNH